MTAQIVVVEVARTARLTLERGGFAEVSYDDEMATLVGRAGHDEADGVRFACRVKVEPGAGLNSLEEGVLVNAGSTLYVSVATDYREKGRNLSFEADRKLVRALDKPASELREDHLAEHRRLFRRSTLDLGGHDARELPTDERLAAVKEGPFSGSSQKKLLMLWCCSGRPCA